MNSILNPARMLLGIGWLVAAVSVEEKCKLMIARIQELQNLLW